MKLLTTAEYMEYLGGLTKSTFDSYRVRGLVHSPVKRKVRGRLLNMYQAKLMEKDTRKINKYKKEYTTKKIITRARARTSTPPKANKETRLFRAFLSAHVKVISC